MYKDIYEEIIKAREILKGNANITPIFDASNFGENVYLKMENLQKTGSFKFRGAYNKINNLTDQEKAKGVIASSAGNHAQGVAKSATKQGISSLICIPAFAPIAKIEATRNYGAEVELVEGGYDDSYIRAIKLAEEKDLVFLHPFDDKYVIAGQGTIGLEILEQLPNVERIVVPIGGGGLISGIAVAVKSLRPDIEIIGVEPTSAASMKKSVENGCVTEIESAVSLADGIAVRKPGQLTFDIVNCLVDEIIEVTDEEIAEAILNLLEKNKLVSEGAGASAIAAISKLKDDKVTCAVLSGGNINVNMVSRIIQKGLYKSGRLCEITTLLEDKPGELNRLLNHLKDLEVNILTINQYAEHERNTLGKLVVRLVLETKGSDQVDQLYKMLASYGYKHYR